MNTLFSFDSLISLFTLCLLEIVLGIDNVIFVPILIDRLPVIDSGGVFTAAHARMIQGEWM